MGGPFEDTGNPPPIAKEVHHSGWRVTSQLTDQVIITEAGKAVTGVQIFFITGNGNEGSIFVANNHYVPKVVRPQLHAAAQQIDTIGQMAANAQ